MNTIVSMRKKLVGWLKGKRSVTLTEVLVVIMIIAILAALTIPMYTKTVEKARDSEAITILKLIRTGEEIYKLENHYYYPHSSHGGYETDISAINYYLSLNLDPDNNTTPQANERAKWDYWIENASESTFTVQAERMNPPSVQYEGVWHINENMTEPVKQ